MLFTSLVVEPAKFGGDYGVEFNYWGEEDKLYFTYEQHSREDANTASITLGDLFNLLVNKRNYEASLEDARETIVRLGAEKDALKKEYEILKREFIAAKESLDALKKTIVLLNTASTRISNYHIVDAVSKQQVDGEK